MEAIYNRSWLVSIRRDDEGNAVSTGAFLDNFIEQKASIVVKSNDFSILSADIETLRGLSETEHNTTQSFSGLNGLLVLSDNVGQAVRESINNDPKGYRKAMLLETIRAVVLSRSFFIKELGYQDEDGYYKFWSTKLKDTCVYQSNQDKVVGRFRNEKTKLGFNNRINSLFHRMQNLIIYRVEDGLLCCSSLVDTFHQINVMLRINNNLQVTEAKGTILRSPDKICSEATNLLNRLVGYPLKSNTPQSKSIRTLVGSSDGCFHMSNLVLEIASSFELLSIKPGKLE